MSQVVRFASLLLVGAYCVLNAQSTQGVISGRVFDDELRQGIAFASVTITHPASGHRYQTQTDLTGQYWFHGLSVGDYTVTVTAPNYVARVVFNVQLFVGGFAEVDVQMRPAATEYARGGYASGYLPLTDSIVHVYAADVQTTVAQPLEAPRTRTIAAEASQSYVLAPEEIQYLPLGGRDVYSIIAAVPGVQAQSSIPRGAGLTANGQRATSTYYLLDGSQINDPFVTGPVAAVGAESVSEYRISVGTYAAEFGGAAGFLANAVTRSGTNNWHAQPYVYMRHNALTARSPAEKAGSRDAATTRELQAGIWTGGPVIKNLLFASLASDALRFRGRRDPVPYRLPTQAFIQSLPAGSSAGRLLRAWQPAVTPSGPGPVERIYLIPRTSVNRVLATPRIDAVTGNHRLFGRLAVASVSQPDLIYNPYEQFTAPYRQDLHNAAATWTWNAGPTITAETRVGTTTMETSVDRPLREVPQLLAPGVTLPGADLFYGFGNRSGDVEGSTVVSAAWRTHLLKLGGSHLWRRLRTERTFGRDGTYFFNSLDDFVAGVPGSLDGAVPRNESGTYSRAETLAEPEYERRYGYRVWSVFLQDSFRATRLLTLNYGIRIESLGSPSSVDETSDFLVQWGVASSARGRLPGSRLIQVGPRHSMYDADQINAAPRLGFALLLSGRLGTVLRGGWGFFYDRIFDNLWETVSVNRFQFASWSFAGPIDFLAPVAEVKQRASAFTPRSLVNPVSFQPGVRNGRSQNYFLSLQQQVGQAVWAEITAAGSRAASLITTDRINRSQTVEPTVQNPAGLLEPALPQLAYRANQGNAEYYALTALLRFRADRFTGHAAYTFSRAIDVQSDPLSRDFLDLTSPRLAGSGSLPAFTRQFRPDLDRASADFDQRHNLVFFGTFDIPAARGRLRLLASNWRVSSVGAIRSGTPFSVFVRSPQAVGELIINNRADLSDPAAAYVNRDVPGGRVLLDAGAFTVPMSGQIGNTGRNAFVGPGQISFDLSLARRLLFSVRDRVVAITFRADIYNALNHANLSNPLNTSFVNPAFGPDVNRDFAFATFGRTAQVSGLPLSAPLSETPRQVQLMFRFDF